MQRLLNQLAPFFWIGIAVVVMTVGVVLLAHLILFGALVGLILFIAYRIKQSFFPSKMITPIKKNKKGRTFDASEWKKL